MLFLMRTRPIKNLYRKIGIKAPEKRYVKNFAKIGMNEIWARSEFFILCHCFALGTIGFLVVLIRLPLNMLVHHAVCAICAIVFEEWIFSNHKKYFQKFDKMSKGEKKKSAWITFFFVIVIPAYALIAMIVYDKFL
jgi:hypothetical protein